MTLTIAGKTFNSRLMVGTGKFDDFAVMQHTHEASGAEVVTVAIRRVDTGAPGHVGLMDYIDTDKYWILPNTAGCATAEEAIRVARLARGMGINNWVKLEVIPDTKYLLPDPIEALRTIRLDSRIVRGVYYLKYLDIMLCLE